MQVSIPFAFLALAFLSRSLASLHPHRSFRDTAAAPAFNDTLLPQKTVYQFSTIPTWIENLAVRENGELILILLSSNELYSVDPSQEKPTKKLITTIPGRTSLFAIAELEPDVFYVSAGNFSILTGVLEPGSFSVFEVDLRHEEVKVQKVLDIPEALLLNGMVGLPGHKELLIPDSIKGVIWKVNVKTKAYEVAVDVLETHAGSVGGKTSVGVNGIKLHAGWLYFTNSKLASLYRVKFDAVKGCLSSKENPEVEKLATNDVFMDDLAVDHNGVVWVTTNSGNVVLAVANNGKEVAIVAGKKGGLDVGGPTACAFGRRKTDTGVLYVVTTGGLGGGVDGGSLEGGKIVAVDTNRFLV